MATEAHKDGAGASNSVSQGAVKPRSGIAARWEDWVEEQKRKNDERASKPDNVIVSKFAVALCVGLLVWCYYVYVGRICTPMIRRDPAARGSRAQGIVFLFFFNILWLLMVYTYAAVVLTPPGFARDYVEQGPEPDPPWAASQPAPWQGNSSMNGGHPNMQQTTTTGMNGSFTPIQNPMDDTEHVAQSMPQAGALGTGIARAVAIAQQPQAHQDSANKQNEQPPIAAPMHSPQVAMGAQNDNSSLPLDKSGQKGQPRMPDPAAQPTSLATTKMHGREFRASNQPVKPFPRVFREPPQRLALHPHTRYCRRCQIVKPPRTHHCRHCGTCVLNMDHHCPWIGQCCGARNHIYFLTFCFWAAIALTYIFITVLISIIAPNASPDPNELDAQSVVICAIAAVLGFFTASMAVTHYMLIINAQSTIENLSIGDMKHREKASLNREYPIFAFKDKQRERKLMEQTWGKLDTEANLWWQGSRMENWKITMGPGVLKWILPPPKYTPDDGLHYTPNPRRGPMGLWRTRQQWPPELQ